jgi:DNA-binding protein H-NS
MAKRVFNFTEMEIAELVQLREEIETALSGKILMEREELEARIANLTALAGRRSRKASRPAASTSDKTSGRAKRASRATHPLKGRKAEPKYRGPGGEIWTGRGLPPRWLTALEKKGKKREQYLISK